MLLFCDARRGEGGGRLFFSTCKLPFFEACSAGNGVHVPQM